jgi:hypothetical protein
MVELAEAALKKKYSPDGKAPADLPLKVICHEVERYLRAQDLKVSDTSIKRAVRKHGRAPVA